MHKNRNKNNVHDKEPNSKINKRTTDKLRQRQRDEQSEEAIGRVIKEIKKLLAIKSYLRDIP